jgi:hypothetical protein
MGFFVTKWGESDFATTSPYPEFCDTERLLTIPAKNARSFYESSALPLSYPGGRGNGNKPSASLKIQPKLLFSLGERGFSQ